MNELELAIQDRPAQWSRGTGSVLLMAGTFQVWAYRRGASTYELAIFRGNRNWQLTGFNSPDAALSAGETMASLLAELVPGADEDEVPVTSTAKVVRINE